MHKAMKIVTTASMITMLSITLVGCGGGDNKAHPTSDQTSTKSATPMPHENAGFIASYDSKLALEQPTSPNADNYIVSSNYRKFTITATGQLAMTPFNTAPANGEVFYAINYTYPQDVTTKYPSSEDPKVTVTINGKTVTPDKQLYQEGTFVVSAPENAKISLSVGNDGVTQDISMNDGKRTPGTGDGFYETTNGTLSRPSIQASKDVAGVKANLSISLKDVSRQPFINDYMPHWADGGKKTWVILDLSDPSWTATGKNDVSITGVDSKISLVDSTGKSYPGTPMTSDSMSDNATVLFAVPIGVNTFTLHTENSSKLQSWGDVIGTTGLLKNDDVTVKFQSDAATAS